MVHVSSALAAAHKLGMIHRDIKPSNVMVTRHGVAKLADFGLAKRLVAQVEGTDTRVLAGTPQYMAPELFRGEPANKRSDVFAMGVMYFCLLTRRLPIPSQSVSELLKIHAQETATDLEDVIMAAGNAAGLLVQRCLAHDPQRRYADAVQLHEEFRALYGSLRSLGSLLGESLAGSGATITGSGDRFVVSVKLAGGRSQRVYVEACQGAAVTEQVVKIYSICGPVCQRYLRRALELNAEIPYGSIAIQTVEGQPHFVMSNAYPRATCDPEEVRQSALTIARYADKVEHRLTGGDTH
jgi:serine/threonine-protein kinase